jgi:hypothetical protein
LKREHRGRTEAVKKRRTRREENRLLKTEKTNRIHRKGQRRKEPVEQSSSATYALTLPMSPLSLLAVIFTAGYAYISG